MFIRHTFLKSILVSAVAAAALAACGHMGMGQSGGKETFEAKLSAAQEVPPGSGQGAGTAEVQLDKGTSMVSWKLNYSGLSGPAVAGHIHGPAAAGQNAGVVVPFTGITSQPVSGQATVTPAQIADLEAGKWYVNVQTAANPGGEIRGQLQKR